MDPLTAAGVVAVGLAAGFLGGLLGKGGSAVATPVLHLLGIPAMAAVASPLPATVPSTLVAARAYSRHRLVEKRVVAWTVAVGVPATVLGAVSTRWIEGEWLVWATELLLVGIGVRLLAAPAVDEAPEGLRTLSPRRMVAVGAAVGVLAGLLANSGGFLLAPLFITVLGRPIKLALGTSLVVASLLAIPGSIVHVALGNVDWMVAGLFAAASIPCASLGARVALRTPTRPLERIYGGLLVVLGTALLAAAVAGI